MNSFYTRAVKPIVDRSAAALGLAALAPLMIGIAATIRIAQGPPIFFRQKRAGLHGRPFELVKFCTMTLATDEQGTLLPDDQRVTPMGRFLRETSLDELPGLFNVVRGEMSLVGPRPLPCEYLQYYSAEQHRRHDVMPGITGWAAVNGRNTTTWAQRFVLDLHYVDNIGPAIDLLILVRTVSTVLSRKAVNPIDASAMEPFRG